MKTHLVLQTLSFSLAVTSLSSAMADKPNLIVIMADDVGYADVGFNGCKDIPTPHIDSIAADGVKFTSGYVSYSVCGPSRAGFITGRYEQRFGFERNPQYRPSDRNMGLTTDETTIADALGKIGYRCGVVGKWHLGASDVHHPLRRGFHEFFGHLGGGHRYFPEELTIKESAAAKDEPASYRTWILKNHTPVKTTKYLTDEFSDAAVRFVSDNKDEPFFLFLSYNAPHTPLQATKEYLDRFPNISDEKRKTYAAMVSAVDDGIGRVLSKLRELELDDDTIVFFLSDNGGPTTKNASRNEPLRGNKGDAWEGGFRVPFAAKWPGGLPKGTVYDQPVSSLDIFATIAALAGTKNDPDRPLDGVNLVPYVTGKKDGPPHEAIYLRMFDSQKYVIRSGDYKLVIPARNVKPQLYNLTVDISESKNLALKHSDKLGELQEKLDAWTRTLVEPRFLGLIHTDAWKKRSQNAGKKNQQLKDQ